MAEQAPGRRVAIYDTTLRDGSQGEGISFSLQDKLRIAHRLDEFGMDYVEGGWPGSNPKDIEFFEHMRKAPLAHARLAAFGSTRRPGIAAGDDAQVRMLVESGTPVVTIFGKSWDFQVTHALKIALSENLEMVHDTVRYLAARVGEVVYDAEHFFDGYRANPGYALRCLEAARTGGAAVLVLCDTNGGTLPHEVAAIVAEVRDLVTGAIGIHAHDDCACGVANTLVAVREGASHAQGTVNGYGERCGNANLTAIMPNLRLKMGLECVLPGSLEHLTGLSQYVDEVANVAPNTRQPYVGRSAFAHKAGVHIDAIMKHRATYEHVDPERVGNSRRMLVSELSGGSTIVSKAAKHRVDLAKKSPETRALLKRVAEMERDGYSFEGAEASFELLLMQTVGTYRKLFDFRGFRVIVEQREAGEPITEATIKLGVDGVDRLTVAEGDGPVHALDSALRKALLEFYPELASIRLTDFKVRVVNVREGTAARVRTIIDSSDGDVLWSTVGVSTNMIEASWHALVDGVVYGLLRSRAVADDEPAA
ncbi:MAG: citramalate synthase [Chthonomonadales bacterium]|nr:citramalate synthase [Chthonomonadales bacterium]